MLPKSVFSTKLKVIAHKTDDKIENKAPKGYEEMNFNQDKYKISPKN